MSINTISSRRVSQKEYFKDGLIFANVCILFLPTTAIVASRIPDAKWEVLFLMFVSVFHAGKASIQFWRWHKLAFPSEHAEDA